MRPLLILAFFLAACRPEASAPDAAVPAEAVIRSVATVDTAIVARVAAGDVAAESLWQWTGEARAEDDSLSALGYVYRRTLARTDFAPEAVLGSRRMLVLYREYVKEH